ncbi:hypothetical protein SynMINOS11_02590 [Synechococcus sp. Minos11]|nr:hypothetical protein SynMINOS11_02590 [Synechococcus sp. Minos11]
MAAAACGGCDLRAGFGEWRCFKVEQNTLVAKRRLRCRPRGSQPVALRKARSQPAT